MSDQNIFTIQLDLSSIDNMNIQNEETQSNIYSNHQHASNSVIFKEYKEIA